MESVTPKYDLTWYIKWVSSIFVLIAVTFRSSGVSDFLFFDLIFSWLGVVGWFYVGWRWNDRAIMVLNGTLGVILFAGILRYIFA
jgi:hypothetical protein